LINVIGNVVIIVTITFLSTRWRPTGLVVPLSRSRPNSADNAPAAKQCFQTVCCTNKSSFVDRRPRYHHNLRHRNSVSLSFSVSLDSPLKSRHSSS
jgi:hypothetical protein